jgi:hypothetical protein
MEAVINELAAFIGGTRSGYLQLLVAAADKRTYARIVDCPTYPTAVRQKDLARAVALFRTALGAPGTHAPTLLAKLYYTVRSLEQRKRVGQFFTSAEAAAFGVKVADLDGRDVVCDAGVGTGAFAWAILDRRATVQSYTGIENDPLLALAAAHVLEVLRAPSSFHIWYANFLLLTRTDFGGRDLQLPDVIIANPPFVRFHALAGRDRLIANFRSSGQFNLSPFSGAGTYFLSKAAELVALGREAGSTSLRRTRLVFFFPKEMTGAAHANLATRQLALRGWSRTELEIPVAKPAVDKNGSSALALCFVFRRESSSDRKAPARKPTIIRLDQCLRIYRGLSTGYNKFFVLNDEAVAKHRLPRRRLKAVLPTRIHLDGEAITEKTWNELRRDGHPCWVLSLPDNRPEDFEAVVREYLQLGVELGVNKSPTAQKMKTWYALRLPVQPPDLFVTYLFRGAPKFVLNEAGVWHLTNILGGSFSPPIGEVKRQRLAVQALNKQAKRWAAAGLPGRQYRGGLSKIEPGEFGSLPIDKAAWSAFGVRKGDMRAYQEQLIEDLFDPEARYS